MRDWKLENSGNGKEISAIPFGTEKEDYLQPILFVEKVKTQENCVENSVSVAFGSM